MSSRTSKRATLRTAVAAGLALAAGAIPMVAGAVSVIPQAIGFGTDTVAGRGGAVHRVTNLNADGAGSLKACVDGSGPRTCVFEVSGTIKMPGDLIVRNPNITIAGQTAPSPGIMLRGGGLLIKTSDVLVQHIRVRPGDDPTGTTPENRDALKIEGPASAPIKNIVVDHCSFAWSIDEMASLWVGWDNVTLSNNIFAEPLNESLHPKGSHGYGMLLGPVKGKATIIGNLFTNNVERNPLSRASNLVFANNVVYNRSHNDLVLDNEGGLVMNATLVGNVFIRGSNYVKSSMPLQIRAAGTSALSTGSKIYIADNRAQEMGQDPWDLVGYFGDAGDVKKYKSETPPVWPAGLTRLPTDQDVVLNNVLRQVGARPADRDSTDKRIIDQVRNRTGGMINCVAPNGTTRCQKNAGGWPTLAQNKRTLTLPANAAAVAQDGYTNLEVWLHSMAAEVEGRKPVSPRAPALTTQNR